MKKLLVVALVAASFISFEARAQNRAGDAALGAVSGAVVLGPVGAVRCGDRIYGGTFDRAFLGSETVGVAITRAARGTSELRNAATSGCRGERTNT